MEITVNIMPNDYVQPKEVRPEVVQGICEAFLASNAYRMFYPFRDGWNRMQTHYIVRHSRETAFSGFMNEARFKDEVAVHFNGEEMKCAFQALIKAGYHIFRKYYFGTWMAYFVSKKPFEQNAKEVFEFNDFID